jgi:Domain of unknown function (DUF3943)
MKNFFGTVCIVGMLFMTTPAWALPNCSGCPPFVPGRSEDLVSKTGYLIGIQLAFLGLLTQMPEDTTGWNRAKYRGQWAMRRWVDNISQAPVWDTDKPKINYVGHPIAGGWYYLMARDSGFGYMGSFVYSAFVSTFLWEYGVEATYERPSIQDLIYTPVGGFVAGAVSEAFIDRINNNDGRAFGSRWMGSVTKFLLSPLDAIVKGVRHGVRRLFGRGDAKVGLMSGYDVPKQMVRFNPRRSKPTVYGLRLEARF